MKTLGKKYLLFSMCVSFFITSQSYAIQFYRSFKNGTLSKITELEFNKCKQILYRNMAQEELPFDHKRKLLEMSAAGKTINSLGMAKNMLKAYPGMCTYGSDQEHFLPSK